MDSSHSASSYPVDSCKHNEHHNFPWTWSGWAWYSMWACFFRVQKSWVCLLILKTMPSCPGLTPTLHSTICLTAGSVEHSPLHQRKASHGGHLHFKERTFFLQGWKHLWQQSYVKPLLNLMTSNNPKMAWCNTLHLNYGHNGAFNLADYSVFAICSLHL